MRRAALAASIGTLICAPWFVICTPAKAQVPGSPPPTDDARLDALSLAALIEPEPYLAEANTRNFCRRVTAAADQGAAVGESPASDPARLAQACLAGAQAIRADVLTFYPEQQRAKADLYARELSPDDLRAALSYYRSPLGLKIVATGFAAMNGNLEADRVTARANAMASLTDAERAQVVAFGATTAAQRLHAAYAERQAISREWAKRHQEKMFADADAAMKAAMASSAVRSHP